MKKWLKIFILFILSCENEFQLNERIVGFSAGGADWFPEQVSGNTLEEKAHFLALGLKEVGARWYRPGIPLRAIQNEINPCAEEIESIIEKGNWRVFETVLTTLKKEGISLIAGIGIGYTNALPLISEEGCMKEKAGTHISPDLMGREKYIEMNYLFAKSAVRRFKEIVKIWQIENELNVACETVIWGWREGSLWCDWEFLDSLMDALYRAVKEEDPDALITHNFHTDLHWRDDVRRWYHYIDIIGLDAYPNYLNGKRTYGKEVGKRVGIAKGSFPEKPVIVLETGYPTAPAERNFSEEGQTRYIRDAINSTFENGGSGFLYFTFITSEKEEIKGLQAVEPFWGLIRRDGTKPSWYVIKELFERYGD